MTIFRKMKDIQSVLLVSKEKIIFIELPAVRDQLILVGEIRSGRSLVHLRYILRNEIQCGKIKELTVLSN